MMIYPFLGYRLFNKLVEKLEFGDQVSANAFVGEATSLPRGITSKNGIGSGEFVQITNILPFNQPLKNHNVGGGW